MVCQAERLPLPDSLKGEIYIRLLHCSYQSANPIVSQCVNNLANFECKICGVRILLLMPVETTDYTVRGRGTVLLKKGIGKRHHGGIWVVCVN